MARARLHGHEAAMEEAQHVAQGVHRTHRARLWSVIRKHLHLVRSVHIVAHAVGAVGVACSQHLVGLRAFGDGVGEARNDASPCAAPWFGVAPFGIKAGLCGAHVGEDGLLGILLHAAVERSVDFQPVDVGVELGAVVHQVARYGLAEVVGLSFIHVGSCKVEFQRFRLEAFALARGEVAAALHVVEHRIAARQTALGVQARTIGAGSFQ